MRPPTSKQTCFLSCAKLNVSWLYLHFDQTDMRGINLNYSFELLNVLKIQFKSSPYVACYHVVRHKCLHLRCYQGLAMCRQLVSLLLCACICSTHSGAHNI